MNRIFWWFDVLFWWHALAYECSFGVRWGQGWLGFIRVSGRHNHKRYIPCYLNHSSLPHEQCCTATFIFYPLATVVAILPVFSFFFCQDDSNDSSNYGSDNGDINNSSSTSSSDYGSRGRRNDYLWLQLVLVPVEVKDGNSDSGSTSRAR